MHVLHCRNKGKKRPAGILKRRYEMGILLPLSEVRPVEVLEMFEDVAQVEQFEFHYSVE